MHVLYYRAMSALIDSCLCYFCILWLKLVIVWLLMPQLLWTLATNTMYVHAIDVEITNLVSGDLCEILTDLNQVAW